MCVRVCVCVCVYTYMYIYIYVYVYVCCLVKSSDGVLLLTPAGSRIYM